MNFLFFEKPDNAAYLSQVYELLKKCDKEFVPPLSHRTSTTQQNLSDFASDEQNEPTAYFQQLCSQSIILAMEQEKVLGFMSFRNHHVCDEVEDHIPTIYVSTVIVDPAHRGKGLSLGMYQTLIGIAQERNLPISTRTWSGNDTHIDILSRLGFYELLRIRDARGAGIDTVYFRKDNNGYEKESIEKI